MKSTFPREALTGFALAVLAALPIAAQSPTRPSDALHDIVRGRLEHVRWTPVQAESALKPVLSNIQTTGLTADEEVALALSYFFTFNGLSAKPLFEKHRNRNDAFGRVSWQSLQQMSFFGAKDYALVEQRTREYRTKFAPTIDDTEYTFNMVNNLSRLAATSGDHARAVSLVLEDIGSLPIELPFRSFDLLAQRYASFQAVNRGSDAIAWMKRHRDALRGAAASSDSSLAMSSTASLTIPHREGVVHLTPFADLLYPDDVRWTRVGAVRFQRAAAIVRLDRWIAAAEKGEPLVP